MNDQESRTIYLDNNASTEPLPEVREAMLRAMGPEFSNPSSAHALGGKGKRLLAQSREQLTNLLTVQDAAIFFTGSGTEANNWAIRSALFSGSSSKRLITSPIEHSSVLKQADALADLYDIEVIYVPVLSSGQVDIEALEHLINAQTGLVSVQWVNNETGVIQPVEDICQICQKMGVSFHTDAAQAVGKLEIDLSRLPAEYVTLTGHKFHAPQGIGALIAHRDAQLATLLYGGGQEAGLRAGTENMPGIAGLGKAAELRNVHFSEVAEYVQALRDRFESRILQEVDEVEVNGAPQLRVGNTSNLLFRGVEGQALMARLDQVGILCSQSSACTSSRPEPSYILREMGRSEDEAYSSVRFSFSELNTMREVDQAVENICEIVSSLRAFARIGT